ncbi:hypothetical protein K2X40_03495 [Candidatus Babeliales bacterium]|nr:hypothetical protein [Candidatus Babeliales bacterium]
MKQYIIVLAIFFLYSETVLSVPTYDKNIDTLLCETFNLTTKDQGYLAPDISFLFIDFKFNNGNVKICELGASTHAGLTDSQVFVRGKQETMVSPYWNVLWPYLNKFTIPVWFVGWIAEKHRMTYHSFKALDGKRARSLKDLEKKSLFQDQAKKRLPNNPSIQDHAGIIIYRRPKGESYRDRKKFQKKYPNFLFLNDASRSYTAKHETAKLLEQNGLQEFKPGWHVYPKKYSPDLAQKISYDLPGDIVVIKPLKSMQSRGVNIIKKEDLDELLKLILEDHHTIPLSAHRSLSHWKRDKSDSFIVEEFATSHLITREKRRYQPTMRIVFGLTNNTGIISLTVFGGFWKIPLKSVDDPHASLIEQNVTIPFQGPFYVGIPISPRDMTQVKKSLGYLLPRMHLGMLKARKERKS